MLASDGVNGAFFAALLAVIGAAVRAEDDNGQVEGPDKPREFFFLLFAVATATFTRILFKKFDVKLPTPVVMLMIGLVLGVTTNRFEIVKTHARLMDVSQHYILTTILPVIVFKTALCLDAHLFLKSWTQITLISVPRLVLSAVLMGVISCQVGYKWTWTMGILYGIITVPIYPLDATNRVFKDVERNSKHLGILLEGEAMVGTGVAIIMFEILARLLIGGYTKWYEVPIVCLRYAGGGTVLGFVMGKISCLMIRHLFNDYINVVVTTLSLAFMGYYLAEYICYVCGSVTVMLIGIMCSIERANLTVEVDGFLLYFWDILAFIATNVIYLVMAALIAAHLMDSISMAGIFFAVISHMVVLICRMTSFVLLAPVLSRTGYGLSFVQLIVLVWSGVRGAVTIFLVLMIYQIPEQRTFGHDLLIYCSGPVFITTVVNGSTIPAILRMFGLTELSLPKKINMNNCMKHIAARREKAIATLKMDRFLLDANWPLVNAVTTLVHPYKFKDHSQKSEDDDDDDDSYLGMKVGTCPDCMKEVLGEPSPKEYAEMTREARLRILKAKKISYARQYENGLLSKDSIRILRQAVDVAMDTEELLIEIDGLQKLFKREDLIHRLRRHILIAFFKEVEMSAKPPRKHWRRVCYYIIMHWFFDYVIYGHVVLNVVATVTEMCYPPKLLSGYHIAMFSLNIYFFIVYLLEFWLKIFGYSQVFLCRHGFKTYFSSAWNVFDFVILLTALGDVVVDYLDLSPMVFNKHNNNTLILVYVFRLARTLRLLRLFRLWKNCFGRVLRYCDSKIDGNMAFAYDVGKGFVKTEEEVTEMLHQMIDNKAIQDQMWGRMQADRLAITKELGLVQKDRPWIAITVKTKQAIRSTLNSMQETINDLKVSGWVDDNEYKKLMESLEETLRHTRSIRSVEPNQPKVIFQEVPWLSGDEDLTEFLYERVATRIYEPGDIVCSDGLIPEGIFIVVTGLFKLSYYPRDEVLEQLRDFGVLPIIDYVSTTVFEERFENYIVTGNCIGELCALTGRPYNCMVKADTPSQVFVLSHEDLQEAVKKNRDLINGLQAKMWKSVCTQLAMEILMEVPAYQSKTQHKIRYVVESAFVPDLSKYKVFVVNEMIADIVLLEGAAVDFNTRDMYVAPCYIPRTVQKLVLPKSSLMNTLTAVETKLLIIPAKDTDEYDIMENEEMISEMVSTASMSCLQHTMQKRYAKKKRKKFFHMTQKVPMYSRQDASATSSMKSIMGKGADGGDSTEEKASADNRQRGKRKSNTRSMETIGTGDEESAMWSWQSSKRASITSKQEEHKEKKAEKLSSIVEEGKESTDKSSRKDLSREIRRKSEEK